jgi:ribosomal protein L11 methyltransferase
VHLWIIKLPVLEEHAGAWSDILAEEADSVSTVRNDDDSWRLEAICRAKPAGGLAARLALAAAALGVPDPSVTVEPLPDADWLMQVYAGFPPLRVGRLFVHGSHDAARVRPGTIPVRIDAATAFGSGQHESTQGCLIALEKLGKGRRFRRVLDMGCGSGILGIAAAKLWRARVTAVDIESEAARVTRANAKLNGVIHRLEADAGNGYRTPLVRRRAPYDLILSNILARPLARMAPDLRSALEPGGLAILSGLLERQERGVINAHCRQGLRLKERVRLGPWTTLILDRPSGKATGSRKAGD